MRAPGGALPPSACSPQQATCRTRKARESRELSSWSATPGRLPILRAQTVCTTALIRPAGATRLPLVLDVQRHFERAFVVVRVRVVDEKADARHFVRFDAVADARRCDR